MKSADIRIGQDYAIGKRGRSVVTRGRALELRRRSGKWGRTVTEVKITYQLDQRGEPVPSSSAWVPRSQVRCPWERLESDLAQKARAEGPVDGLGEPLVGSSLPADARKGHWLGALLDLVESLLPPW
jgi:hypothetical protein